MSDTIQLVWFVNFWTVLFVLVLAKSTIVAANGSPATDSGGGGCGPASHGARRDSNAIVTRHLSGFTSGQHRLQSVSRLSFRLDLLHYSSAADIFARLPHSLAGRRIKLMTVVVVGGLVFQRQICHTDRHT